MFTSSHFILEWSVAKSILGNTPCSIVTCTVKARSRVGYSQPCKRPTADQEKEQGVPSAVRVAQWLQCSLSSHCWSGLQKAKWAKVPGNIPFFWQSFIELILNLLLLQKGRNKNERGSLSVEQLPVLFALFFFTVLGSALALFSSFPSFPERGEKLLKKA